MKVSKLISELKKLPKNLEVGVAMNDNNENEVAGWVMAVIEIVEEGAPGSNKNDCAERCVVLRC